MIVPAHSLPLTKQAAAPGISRSSVYYLPQPVSERDQALMNRVDRVHLDYPFAGARMRRDMLHQAGVNVGRKHVGTLMRNMGIEALYRKPETTKRHPAHQVYPYLLRGLPITRANQVWAMDVTYVPMARGFVYLAMVMDWYSRRVLSHRVSISMDTQFCLHAYESTRDAKSKIAHYFNFYNQRRPHSTLDRQTPDIERYPTRQIREFKRLISLSKGELLQKRNLDGLIITGSRSMC